MALLIKHYFIFLKAKLFYCSVGPSVREYSLRPYRIALFINLGMLDFILSKIIPFPLRCLLESKATLQKIPKSQHVHFKHDDALFIISFRHIKIVLSI